MRSFKTVLSIIEASSLFFIMMFLLTMDHATFISTGVSEALVKSVIGTYAFAVAMLILAKESEDLYK